MMKKLTILIPKIKPPEESDIITNQLNNIFSKISKEYDLKLIWVIFQPHRFEQYKFNDSLVVDYREFNDAISALNYYQPDLIITEVRLGINGIIFAKSGNFLKIPVLTITPTGESEFFSQIFSLKSNFQLIMSNKVIADASKKKKPKKFAMLRYSLDRYSYLLNTLKNINYTFFALVKFFMLYPRIQIFSKSYPALDNITSGDLNICFNKHWESRLVKADFPKNSIFLCGDPAFDNLFHMVNKEKNIDSNFTGTRILFCPTPMHEHGWMTKKDEDDLIVKLIKKIQTIDNFQISLKIHPSTSSFQEYDELFKIHNLKINLFQKEDIFDLLQKSDVMLTYGSSNVILDAILLHKPVILLKNQSIPELSRLDDQSIISECNEIDKLENLIKTSLSKSISKEIFESYITKQIGNFDGKNSEKIAEQIIQLIKNN